MLTLLVVTHSLCLITFLSSLVPQPLDTMLQLAGKRQNLQSYCCSSKRAKFKQHATDSPSTWPWRWRPLRTKRKLSGGCTIPGSCCPGCTTCWMGFTWTSTSGSSTPEFLPWPWHSPPLGHFASDQPPTLSSTSSSPPSKLPSLPRRSRSGCMFSASSSMEWREGHGDPVSHLFSPTT